MNLKTGLFRIWIICSIIWAAYIVYNSSDDVSYFAEYYSNHQKLVKIEKEHLEKELYKAIEDKKVLVYNAERLSKLGIQKSKEAEEIEFIKDLNIEILKEKLKNTQGQPIKPDMSWAFKAFIFPILFPIIVFIVGWIAWRVISWVKRGFTNEKNMSVFQSDDNIMAGSGKMEDTALKSNKKTNYRWLLITVGVVIFSVIITAIKTENVTSIAAQIVAGIIIIVIIAVIRMLSHKLGAFENLFSRKK